MQTALPKKKLSLIEMAKERLGQIVPAIRGREDIVFYPIMAMFLGYIFLNFPLLPLGRLLEGVTYNLRFQARAYFDPPSDPRLVILGIDEQSIDTVGRWPWDRSFFSSLMNLMAVNGMQPKALTYDVVFSNPTSKVENGHKIVDTKPDEELSEAASQLPVVITGALLDKMQDPQLEVKAEARTRAALAKTTLTMPIIHINGDINEINGKDAAEAADLPVDQLREKSLFGFVDATPSKLDGIRWTLPMVVRLQGQLYPSLALVTVMQVLHIDLDNVVVNVGSNVTMTKQGSSGTKKWVIPIMSNGEIWVNYRREDTFAAYSIIALAQNLAAHQEKGEPLAKEANLNKKIVLIGETAEGLADIGPSPLSAQTPLVFTHMNIINSVLKGDYVKFVPGYYVAIGFLIVSWSSLYCLRRASIAWAVSVPALIILIYTGFAFFIFYWDSWLIGLSWPVLAFAGLHFEDTIRRWQEEQKSKKDLKALFSRMVAPEVLTHLMDRPETLKLGGSTRRCTIFFSDIRDYTKISEGMDNEELVRQLNIYFERMVGCIQRRKGTFHKFIGDAIMSSWSAIEAVSHGVETDALNAVMACIEMRRELKLLNLERVQQKLLPLRIGIGLNHGEVLAGQIGAPVFMEFTLMGDAVNTASRLEGMTKHFTTDFVIGESVQALIGNVILLRRMGYVVLKGKSRPMLVYEVLTERERPEDSHFPLDSLAVYEAALDAFYARQFESARDGFAQLAPLFPKDYCIHHYHAESEKLMKEPPLENWDGRIVLESK